MHQAGPQNAQDGAQTVCQQKRLPPAAAGFADKSHNEGLPLLGSTLNGQGFLVKGGWEWGKGTAGHPCRAAQTAKGGCLPGSVLHQQPNTS